MRAAALLRFLLSDDLGKQYSLILLTHIDLYSLALFTKRRKLTKKTTQLNRESQKSNGIKKIFPEPFFPLHLLLSYVDKMRNHHHRISALEEATVGFKPENIKITGECVLNADYPTPLPEIDSGGPREALKRV